jgi:hypothetical protein
MLPPKNSLISKEPHVFDYPRRLIRRRQLDGFRWPLEGPVSPNAAHQRRRKVAAFLRKQKG